MNSWLYTQDGYYANYKAIGKGGDFYTAVSSSSFFGGAIANRIIKSIDEGFLPNNTTIIEVGAHKGYLLADIIQFIYTLRPKLLDTLNFIIIERFENLQQIQKNYFKDSFGDVVSLQHYKSFDEFTLDSAVVVANEIFDAFGCELIKNNQMVYINKNYDIIFDEIDESTKKISNRYNQTIGEVAVGYEEFANSMAKSLKKFEFITFDYGEKILRNDFSIRVYKKHEVFPFFEDGLDIKEIYKLSDITYDVNFTHLIDAFRGAKVDCIEYKTQLSALVEFGLMDLLEILRENVSNDLYLKELNKVKTLITPTIMGERFKMCRFRKGK
jgi:SAM-dependent MidA family methyltransferase